MLHKWRGINSHEMSKDFLRSERGYSIWGVHAVGAVDVLRTIVSELMSNKYV